MKEEQCPKADEIRPDQQDVQDGARRNTVAAAGTAGVPRGPEGDLGCVVCFAVDGLFGF